MGGFPSIRHNEIRELTANLLTEVCNDVCIEPDLLQPIDGEVLTGSSSNTKDGARLDIAANGFWGGQFEQTFFDVGAFNPHAPSNRSFRLASSYRKHELQKKRQYEQQVRLNTPPSLLLANEATGFYKRLACCLATKWDQSYSSTLSWLHCRLTFSLLWCAIQCIRGAHSSCGHVAKSQTPPIDLVNSELHFI